MLLNNGDGTFDSLRTYALGDYPSGLGFADFDGDMDLDFACGNYNDADVAVWYNTGVLGITGPPYRVPTRAGTRIATVVRGCLLLPNLGHDPGSGGPEAGHVPVLLDITGRQVMELKPGANDVSALSPGVYFVQATGSRVRGSEGPRVKVVIQR